MAKKRTSTDGTEALKSALDVGNGECVGISNETRSPLGFEPIIAPMTQKKATNKADERPTYSLHKDGETLVFGVNDVYEHGQRDFIRRQSGATRYTANDYFNLIDVLLLNLFGNHRGLPDRISPLIAINLPVEQYQKDDVVNEVRDTLLEHNGKRDIMDHDKCVLQIQIERSRLFILPESAGALMHYATDLKTLERRSGADLSGSTIVCDVGYETTDMTLFEGMKYQRDRAFTVQRAGMGNITRAVADYLVSNGAIRQSDESRVDRALRPLAGMKSGVEKWIVLPQGEFEISEVYDSTVASTAQRIANRLETFYTEGASRILMAGGGTYHLENALKAYLSLPIVRSMNPEHANVWGAYITLCKAEKRP